jgi:hypothetical protein
MAEQRHNNRLRESLEAVGDRVVVDGGDLLRRGAESAGRPFEGVAWSLRRGVIWPLEDRADALGAPARALGFGAVVFLAAVAGAAALLWAAPNGRETATHLQAPPRQPLAAAKQAADAAPGPTLHGAAPVFGPEPSEGGDASKVASAEALEATGQGDASASAASAAETEKISSTSTASSSTAQTSAVEGPPAGPAAIAVAHEFAAAFVLYETGSGGDVVSEAFGKTATPALAHALLRRPPRLPAGVKVPKARVVNVVAGPSRGRVYAVSVSLLRVGVTSELRLQMERQGRGWRVTNVLG